METPQETLKKLPHAPGVYLYKNRAGETIYVGKAKDLKKRVSQYFQRDDAVGEKTTTLVAQIDRIKTITTDNEFDALLLEAKLIREFLPKYNVISRDDKSPLYIAITQERLPRLLWLRRTSLSLYPKAVLFGPFQSARVVRTVLKQVREVIPYCTQKQRNGKPCFYSHIGLCSPCPSAIVSQVDVRTYRNNIRRIIAILSGKSLSLLHSLEKDMLKMAKRNEFEQAQMLKNRVVGLKNLLERHFDPTMYIQNETFMSDIRKEERESLQTALHIDYINRIECIDISNTQGAYATGSLVVLIDGIPATREYRRFKIRTKEAPNDFAMISEVLKRRLKHTEWPYPDLLVIDGGKGQVAAAVEILNQYHQTIPVIGLAKRFEEVIVPNSNTWNILKLPLSHKGLQLLMRIRDESHRFALKYHRFLRSRAFLPQV